MAMAASPKIATMFFMITVMSTDVVDGAAAAANPNTAGGSFNITEILDEFPEFATFNRLLSQTNLAAEINQRQTITVFVSDNSAAAAAITSLPAAETQKKVVAVQVILDYYDPVKLDAIASNTAQLTTLFQASGAATDGMGFVTFTQDGDDQMAFASSEPGATAKSQLVKVVACRPYNISVMQINTPIIPPGITGGSPAAAGKKDDAADPPLPKTASSVSTMDVGEEPEFSDSSEPSPAAAADAPTSTLIRHYYSMLLTSTIVLGLLI